MSDTVTGNANRDLMILNAIADAQSEGKPLTIAVLGLEHLPSDFDLLESELEGVQAKLKEHDGNVIAYTAELIALASGYDAEQAQAPTDAAPEEAAVPLDAIVASDEPMDESQAQDMLAAANERVAQARGHVMACQQIERDANAKLSYAVTTFVTGVQRLTQNELLRNNARDQQAMRAAVARGDIDAPKRVSVPGPSALDRQAFYSKGGTCNVGYGKKYLNRAAYNIAKTRAAATQR